MGRVQTNLPISEILSQTGVQFSNKLIKQDDDKIGKTLSREKLFKLFNKSEKTESRCSYCYTMDKIFDLTNYVKDEKIGKYEKKLVICKYCGNSYNKIVKC